MFELIKREFPTTEPYKRLPAAAAAVKRGMALYFNAGQLAKATAQVVPTHIAVADDPSTTADRLITVIEIQPDMEFKTVSTAKVAKAAVGTTVQLHTDGLTVTATASGPFTITSTNEGDPVSAVTGKFK